MVKARLEIEHPTFVAPGLNLFDAAAVGFSHAQFDEPKRVVGEPRVTEAEPLAASRPEVGKNLTIDKVNQRIFRSRVRWRRGRFRRRSGGFRGGRLGRSRSSRFGRRR